MAEFQYRVITPSGKEKKGTMEGTSADQVTAVLKGESNIVLEVAEATMLTKDINISLGGKVKVRDYSIFCRQIVSILGAGVSVIDALQMLAEQTANKNFQQGIWEVHDDVSRGEPLAVSMRKRKKIFPEMLCNMVDAGEASGNLEKSFERMAVQFEKDDKLKGTVKKAMIYPIVVLVVMVVVMFAMFLFVIPTFAAMFEDLDTPLPAVTQAVLAASDFAKSYWLLLIVIVVAIVVAYKLYARTESGRWTLDGLKIKIPIFGPLVVKSACAKLGRTLSTLLAAGVPMMDALEITGRNMDNVRFKKAMYEAKEQVARGVQLSRPLKTCGLFPPMVIHMVSIGEETGKTEEMLENIAGYYEEDVQLATEQLTAVLEPLIIIVMAVMVGFLIITILSPMMGLYDALDQA